LLPRIDYQDLNHKEQRIKIKGRERRNGKRGQESKRSSAAATMEEAKAAGGGVGRCLWSYTALRIYSCHGTSRVFTTGAFWAVSYGLIPGFSVVG
jgi:hypothetical protein